METLKAVLADVAAEISTIQHGDRVGDGHDLLIQRLDAVRTRIADAIAADDARIAAEAEAAKSA